MLSSSHENKGGKRRTNPLKIPNSYQVRIILHFAKKLKTLFQSQQLIKEKVDLENQVLKQRCELINDVAEPKKQKLRLNFVHQAGHKWIEEKTGIVLELS